MAVLDQNTLLVCKDENGNKYLLYPITKLDCVDGAENLLRFDEVQELTDEEKARVLANIGALCAPATAQAGQFLKVTSVDENGNITGIEAVTPEEMSGLAAVAQSGDYNDLLNLPEIPEHLQPDWDQVDNGAGDFVKNKPFGLIADLVPNSTYAFEEKTSVSSYHIPAIKSLALVENAAYKVIWDGTEYECVAKWCSYSHETLGDLSAVVIGNPLIPFVWPGVTTDEAATDEPFSINPFGVFTDSTEKSHTVRVYLVNNKKKIDKEWLPENFGQEQIQSDWSQIDETAKDFIKNKPTIPEEYKHPSNHPASMITGLAPVATGGTYAHLFGKPFGDAPRLEESTLPFRKMAGDIDCYICELSEKMEFIKGETYKITWDGVEYTCVCKDVNDQDAINLSNALYFGNLTKFWGAGLGDDTGEPFAVFVTVTDDISYFGSVFVYTTETDESHTISIIPVNSIHKLDAKYLPDGVATEEYVQEEIAKLDLSGGGTAVSQTDILPEQTIVLESEDATSTAAPFMHIDSTGGELYQAFSNLAVGETYIVVWDGETYECTAQDVSDQLELEDGVQYTRAIALGNLPFFLDDAIDSGEPFATVIADCSTTDSDGAVVTVQMAGFQAYPGIAAESVTHTVRIYQQADIQVSWENVTDKPFYESVEKSTILSEVTNPFNYDPDVDGAAYLFSYTPTNEVFELLESDWDSAEVMWDGVSYIVEPQYFSGIKVMGNTGFIAGSDNGIPFLICIAPAGTFSDEDTVVIYAVYDPIEGVTEETTAEDGMVTTTTTYPTIEHKVGIAIRFITVQKIPDKFQNQGDWEETDESSASYIKNKPFGEIVPTGTIIADCSAEYDADDFGFMLTNLYTVESYIDTISVVEGATYFVEVNGSGFVGKGVSGAEILTLTGLSSAEEFTAESGIVSIETDEQGKPACSVVVELANLISFIRLADETEFTNGESYPVKITVLDATKKIDHKYIPGPPEFDLTAMGLPALTLDGTEVSVECDTTELRAALEKNLVKLSFTANTGTEQTVSGIVNAMCMGGSYQCGFLGYLGYPTMLNFVISATAITGRVLTWAT